jgi:hypothetical protein
MLGDWGIELTYRCGYVLGYIEKSPRSLRGLLQISHIRRELFDSLFPRYDRVWIKIEETIQSSVIDATLDLERKACRGVLNLDAKLCMIEM